jgi:hypothetical protein
MRNRNVKLVDRPGTVGYGCAGICSGCYKKAGPGAAAIRAEQAAPANRRTLEAYLASRRPHRAKLGTAA